MAMSEKSIEEYTEKMRGRYARMTGRKARGRLLDEFVEVTGWDRKHGNKVLLGMKRRRGRRGKRGAPRRYGQAVEEVLKTCWLAMDQPCGKRMKDILPLCSAHLDCPEEERLALAGASPLRSESPARARLLGICFWGGVLKAAVEGIGEG